jgi:hypothetical protein
MPPPSPGLSHETKRGRVRAPSSPRAPWNARTALSVLLSPSAASLPFASFRYALPEIGKPGGGRCASGAGTLIVRRGVLERTLLLLWNGQRAID